MAAELVELKRAARRARRTSGTVTLAFSPPNFVRVVELSGELALGELIIRTGNPGDQFAELFNLLLDAIPGGPSPALQAQLREVTDGWRAQLDKRTRAHESAGKR